VTDRSDGPWDAPTEHDDQHELDSADMSGEDPPTTRATDHQRARARSAAIANRLAHANTQAPPRPATLPPPIPERQPARPAPLLAQATPPPPSDVADDAVVLLDRVSGHAALDHAPRRTDSAAGGIVVVATGGDAERVRRLCHKAGLLVPVMSSLAVVHDAMSIVVVGEPSPPAPDRVVHVVRPDLPDERLIDLLRALVSGRVVVEPPQAKDASSPKVTELARRLATLTDRGAIEMTTIEAITLLTAADRAHCLFHDPATGALWSEARRRERGDDRQAVAGLVGWAAQTGQTIRVSPAGDDPRWLQEIDDPDGKPQSRMLVQPIIGADRRVHAVLVAVRRWRHTDFGEQEQHALASFAALAGPALDLAVAAWPVEPRKPRNTLAGTGGRPPLPLIAEPTADAARAFTPPPPAERRPATSPPVPSAQPLAHGSAPPASSLSRPKSGTDSQITRDVEPRDLAVIANEDDARRAKKIARKARIELSTFATIAEAPTHYQVVTLGVTLTEAPDDRIAFAVRSSIPDPQLTDLLVALTSGRTVAPAAPLAVPQSIAEAKRAQIAFAAARKLAVTLDLAAAETLVTSTIKDLLDTDRAHCWYVDPDSGALWSENRKRAGGDVRRAIAGIAGWAARTGRAANVPLASADPRWLGAIDDPGGDPHSQLLVQPIVRADQRVYGVMIAVRRTRRPGFTEPDAAMLARFAALAAPLLEQIAVAHDTQRMLGDDTSARAQPLVATESTMRGILRGTHPHGRWLYLLLGAVIAFAAALLLPR
jgi:GAF domain-containing protein